MAFVIEGRRVVAIGLICDADAAPGTVVDPAVVGAGVELAVSGAKWAQQRALVAAAVQEPAQRAGAVPREDDRLAADLASDEVIGLFDLAFERHEHPGRLEDARHFELEHLRVGKRGPMYTKHARFGTVVNQAARLHESSS